MTHHQLPSRKDKDHMVMLEDTQLKREKNVQAEHCAAKRRGQQAHSHQQAVSVENFTPGNLIWAKLDGSPWWPAMVVDGVLCGMETCKPSYTWIFWFGDHMVSEVKFEKTCDFKENFSQKYKQKSSKSYIKSIQETCQIIACRMGHTIDKWNFKSCLEWCYQGFPYQDIQKEPSCAASSDDEVPPVILRDLEVIKMRNKYGKKAAVQLSVTQSVFFLEENVSKLRSGLLHIDRLCVGCFEADTPHMELHPLVEGTLCISCKDRVKAALFSCNDEGDYIFCTICGCSAEDVTCGNINCGRNFCVPCIKRLACDGSIDVIRGADTWSCFLCTDYQPDVNGWIKIRKNWRNNVHIYPNSAGCTLRKTLVHKWKILSFLTPASGPLIDNILLSEHHQPLRVLSLFDGIATGYFVLKSLGINVSIYYASEIDEDAIKVAKFNFGDSISYLGDVRKITTRVLKEIGPIDLLLGGSPCNDLSYANPARKGLFDSTGTGILFFEFSRILNSLRILFPQHKLFWLFENVTAMATAYKETISRFLECAPVVIDARYFTAQIRARNFWGNIPGMGLMVLPSKSPNLDDMLTRGFSRKAIREKLPTVTTKSNSMKIGKDNTYPIIMEEKEDLLWVTELEELFGFPRHYTDVGCLSLTRRKELLGKCWSVPVILYLLKPLAEFFEVSRTSTQTNTSCASLTKPSNSC